MINGNKAINRVIDDLAGAGHCCFFVKGKAVKSTKAEVIKLNLNLS